jgi:hypothetical protein
VPCSSWKWDHDCEELEESQCEASVSRTDFGPGRSNDHSVQSLNRRNHSRMWWIIAYDSLTSIMIFHIEWDPNVLAKG